MVFVFEHGLIRRVRTPDKIINLFDELAQPAERRRAATAARRASHAVASNLSGRAISQHKDHLTVVFVFEHGLSAELQSPDRISKITYFAVVRDSSVKREVSLAEPAYAGFDSRWRALLADGLARCRQLSKNQEWLYDILRKFY